MEPGAKKSQHELDLPMITISQHEYDMLRHEHKERKAFVLEYLQNLGKFDTLLHNSIILTRKEIEIGPKSHIQYKMKGLFVNTLTISTATRCDCPDWVIAEFLLSKIIN